MMKKVLLIGGMLFALYSNAMESQCQLSPFGGPDIFPWSTIARPFPWDKVKGLWKVNSDSDTIIKIKVTRENARNKHLYVEVFMKEKCESPLMTGVGVISANEKNVARITLTDAEGSTKLMKLAMFKTEDLKMSSVACGDEIMAASLVDLYINPIKDSSVSEEVSYILREPRSGSYRDLDVIVNERESDAPTMMLKKITGSVDYFCKKRN